MKYPTAFRIYAVIQLILLVLPTILVGITIKDPKGLHLFEIFEFHFFIFAIIWLLVTAFSWFFASKDSYYFLATSALTVLMLGIILFKILSSEGDDSLFIGSVYGIVSLLYAGALIISLFYSPIRRWTVAYFSWKHLLLFFIILAVSTIGTSQVHRIYGASHWEAEVLRSLDFFSRTSENKPTIAQEEETVVEEVPAQEEEEIKLDTSSPEAFVHSFCDHYNSTADVKEGSFSGGLTFEELSFNNSDGIRIFNINHPRIYSAPSFNYAFVFGLGASYRDDSDRLYDIAEFLSSQKAFEISLYSGNFSSTGIDFDGDGEDDLLNTYTSNFRNHTDVGQSIYRLVEGDAGIALEEFWSEDSNTCQDITMDLIDQMNPPSILISAYSDCQYHYGAITNYQFNTDADSFEVTNEIRFFKESISEEEYAGSEQIKYAAISDSLKSVEAKDYISNLNDDSVAVKLRNNKELHLEGHVGNDADTYVRGLLFERYLIIESNADIKNTMVIVDLKTGKKVETYKGLLENSFIPNSNIIVMPQLYNDGGFAVIVLQPLLSKIQTVSDPFDPKVIDNASIKAIDSSAFMYKIDSDFYKFSYRQNEKNKSWDEILNAYLNDFESCLVNHDKEKFMTLIDAEYKREQHDGFLEGRTEQFINEFFSGNSIKNNEYKSIEFDSIRSFKRIDVIEDKEDNTWYRIHYEISNGTDTIDYHGHIKKSADNLGLVGAVG